MNISQKKIALLCLVGLLTARSSQCGGHESFHINYKDFHQKYTGDDHVDVRRKKNNNTVDQRYGKPNHDNAFHGQDKNTKNDEPPAIHAYGNQEQGTHQLTEVHAEGDTSVKALSNKTTVDKKEILDSLANVEGVKAYNGMSPNR